MQFCVWCSSHFQSKEGNSYYKRLWLNVFMHFCPTISTFCLCSSSFFLHTFLLQCNNTFSCEDCKLPLSFCSYQSLVFVFGQIFPLEIRTKVFFVLFKKNTLFLHGEYKFVCPYHIKIPSDLSYWHYIQIYHACNS